jgi:Flp pilus assembly pilin Flp
MRLTNDQSHALKCFLMEEDGASLIEYALIGALVIVVCTLALLALVKST